MMEISSTDKNVHKVLIEKLHFSTLIHFSYLKPITRLVQLAYHNFIDSSLYITTFFKTHLFLRSHLSFRLI